VEQPEREQNEQTPHQEELNTNAPEFRPFGLHRHTNAECEREKGERLKLDQVNH
jgi:hypothetical protein